MKYSKFKEKVNQLFGPFTVTMDSNNDAEVYMYGEVDDPAAIISNKKKDKFSVNPRNDDVSSWTVPNDLYELIIKYASTPIGERGIDEHENDKRDKEIADLKHRVDSLESANCLMKASSICNYNPFSYDSSLYGDILGLENDIDTIKNKKPRWFE